MLNLKEEECLILLLILQMGFKFFYHSATVVWFLSEGHYHGKSHLFIYLFNFLSSEYSWAGHCVQRTLCPEDTMWTRGILVRKGYIQLSQ